MASADRRPLRLHACRAENGAVSLADVQLETPRLILREFAEDDWQAVQAWAADAEVIRFEPWGPNTEDQTKAYLQHAIELRREVPRTRFEFGISLKDTSLLIGACNICIQNSLLMEGDIGYTLRRDAWGRGYATETAQALLAFGMNTLDLRRIWAMCHVDNAASVRVLEKVGMLREGHLRKNVFQRGVWRDTYLYATLSEDRAQNPSASSIRDVSTR